MAIKIKWSNLFNMAELDFEPAPPRELILSDELSQCLAWLTAATRHDRKMLRCDDNGSILVTDAWGGLNACESFPLLPQSGVTHTATATKPNVGALISTSTQLVKCSFVRKSGGAAEVIYVPPHQYYWYPFSTYSVEVAVVPDPGGSTSYVGVTCYD